MKTAAFLLGVLCLWSWKPASAQSKCKIILTFNIILSVNNFCKKRALSIFAIGLHILYVCNNFIMCYLYRLSIACKKHYT